MICPRAKNMNWEKRETAFGLRNTLKSTHVSHKKKCTKSQNRFPIEIIETVMVGR